MYNYVVTAHKPSRVSHTSVGSFLGPNQRNLLVAKVTYIQVYSITIEGLVCVVELPINGAISVMQLMTVPGDSQDHLIILTEKFKLCVLRWSTDENRCHVVSSGDMQDHIASQNGSEKIVFVDPDARCIALHQYPRLLKVIPTERDADKTAFNVRLLEDPVHDMVFLHGYPYPTFAVLCTRGKDARQIRTYKISMHDQDIAPAAWNRSDLDITTSKLVPVPKPWCGLLAFSDDSIVYLSPSGEYVSCAINTTLITAVGQVDNDGSRYLVGDHKGQLSMLMLVSEQGGNTIKDLRLEHLGETSCASCISYLDNSYVYIGSDKGDSQLVKLSTVRNEMDRSFVEVVQTYPHLGPIIDFCIVKGMGCLRQGQGLVVTCSGIGKDGSLRVIRNGIGITEHASEELPGIKKLVSLRKRFDDRYHSYLIQSFTSETRVQELIGDDEMRPYSIPGLDESSSTLAAFNMKGDVLVQVTAKQVHVIHCSTTVITPGQTWSPPPNMRISVVSGNATQLLVGATGGHLILLQVDVNKKTLAEVSRTKLDREISCISCDPLQTSFETSASGVVVGPDTSFMAAVGLWAEVNESPVVKLLALPSLSVMSSIELGGDIMSRCVLLATMEEHHYLLIALGDGHLLTYSVNAEAALSASRSTASQPSSTDRSIEIVSERRKLNVGTQPADLSVFKSRGANHVFAACDRPTVVYSATGGGKLLISNVNLQEVNSVCAFDTEAFPDCLFIAGEGGLYLGAVDEIQKLHITSIPLGEQPRRIAHLESSRVFAVLTDAFVLDECGDEILENYIRIVDDTRYDTIDRYKLKPQESGSSTLVTSLKGEGLAGREEFLVVGTAVEKPEQEDPNEGRLLIFRIKDGRPVLVAERDMYGAVYSLCAFHGMILASVGPQVRVLSVSERKDGVLDIKEEDRYSGHTLSYRLALRGDFILVGDIYRSVSVLSCKKVGGNIRLEEVARDHDVVWVMALEMLDDDTYIVAEHAKHFYSYRRNSYATTEAERGRLERIGQFHLGTRVNRIQHGSLVMEMPEHEGPALKTLIFGTTDGMLGIVANLKQDAYTFFHELQQAMATLIPGVGGLKHGDWREMVAETPPRTAPANNFLDGDLIERFLDLNLSQMTKVSSMVGVGVEELVQRVEEMQRLHGAG